MAFQSLQNCELLKMELIHSDTFDGHCSFSSPMLLSSPVISFNQSKTNSVTFRARLCLMYSVSQVRMNIFPSSTFLILYLRIEKPSRSPVDEETLATDLEIVGHSEILSH